MSTLESKPVESGHAPVNGINMCNSFGVMDHDVNLESGVTIDNPMRVVPKGERSELVFTLIRQPGMSDGQFAKDSAAVENDLKALEDLLERKSSC